MIKKGDIAVVNTRAGLRMRRSPRGKQAYQKGKPLIRPYGWSARVTKGRNLKGGERWVKFGRYWMAARYMKERPKRSTKPTSPVPGYGVSYAFGVPNSGYAAGIHTGNDHAAPSGARVVAVRPGRIVRADSNGGAYGKWVQLKANNGKVYVHCHLSKINVKVGQNVKAGKLIGKVGSTGNSTGPHLHHEMSRGGVWSYGNVQEPRW